MTATDAAAFALLPFGAALIAIAEYWRPIVDKSPITSERWHDGADRWPEDRMLREWGDGKIFEIAHRRKSEPGIWRHVTGYEHTHDEAVAFCLRAHGYVPDGLIGEDEAWAYERSGARMTRAECVWSVRAEMREKRRNPRKEEGE